MPDFIIIGAQKCGTTSLFNYLKQHPCIFPTFRKEVHFFDLEFSKGATWYRTHFPSSLYKAYIRQMRKQDFITGEATPYYLFHPVVPKRISEIIPQVKLIVLLRNPIDRAYSHYYHELRKGREALSFTDAIEREPERLHGETEKMLEDEDYYSFNHHRYSYRTRGIYVDQLKAWANFFPKEQMLILKSEDFYADPSTSLKQVLEFLNLPSWELKEYKKYNYANYPKIEATTKKRLTDYFQRYNSMLYEYLGMDFDW